MRRTWIGIILATIVPLAVLAGPSQHGVTVTLNYDFSVDNACSATLNSGCVKQFNIYDTTGGATPLKLFSIPAPNGAWLPCRVSLAFTASIRGYLAGH